MNDDDKVVSISRAAAERAKEKERYLEAVRKAAGPIVQRHNAAYAALERSLKRYWVIIIVLFVILVPLGGFGIYLSWQATYALVETAIPAECPNAEPLRAAYRPDDGLKTIVYAPGGVITECRRVSQQEFDALTLKPGVSRFSFEK